MADETLTILLRIDASTKAAQAELARLAGAQDKVGDSATKMADKQDSAFQKAKKSFTEFNSAMALGRQVFGFLGDAADQFAEKNKAASAGWTRASADWDKALGSVKQAVGGLIVQMAPLITAMAKAVSLAADLLANVNGSVAAAQNAVRKSRGGFDVEGAVAAYKRGGQAGYEAWLNGSDLTGNTGPTYLNPANKNTPTDLRGIRFGGGGQSIAEAYSDVQGGVMYSYGSSQEKTDKPRRGGSGGPETYDNYWSPYQTPNPVGSFGHDYWGDEGARIGAFSGGVGASAGGIAFPGADQLAAAQSRMDEMMASFSAAQGESKVDSLMSRMFGAPTEIDAYATAFGALASASTAAFDAWTTGEASIGSAMKASLAAYLGATGKRMGIRALEETAEGVASAFWNPAAAAGHFAAAGLFAAGAVAAGYGAKALGSGDAAAAAKAEKAAAAAEKAKKGSGNGYGANLGGSGGGGSEGSNITVVIGDYFSSDNPRARQGEVARAIRSARRELDDGGGVSFT